MVNNRKNRNYHPFSAHSRKVFLGELNVRWQVYPEKIRN